MNKRFLRVGLSISLVIVSLVILVYATATLNSPVTGGNYSSTMNFTCTASIANALNATLYYNASGGRIILGVSPNLTTITNTSASQTVFTSSAISVSALTEANTYNFSCLVSNYSVAKDIEWSPGAINVAIDRTPPSVTNLKANGTNIIGNNVSGTIVINVTANDTTTFIEDVYFNLTTTEFVQQAFNRSTRNMTADKGANLTYFNYSFDTTRFPDGRYIIYAYANDSLNNINRSESINITIDNNAPAVTLALSSSTVDSLTITITATDSGTGIKGLCTADRTGATITGEGAATQTLTETGLDAGVAYSYTVTCTDYKGHSGSKTASFTTDSGTSATGTTGGGGGGKKYIVTEEQLEESFTRQLKENDLFKVTIESKEHQIIIDSVTTNSATISISDEVEEIEVGQEKKFDVTGDGWYDVSVIVNSIEGNKADVTIKAIHEKISTPEEEKKGAVSKAAEKVKKTLSNLWLWIVIVIAIVAVIAYIVYKKK